MKQHSKAFLVSFYVCTACFLINYVFYKQIMTSGNVPPQRREVVVREDGTVFTELLLFGGMK